LTIRIRIKPTGQLRKSPSLNPGRSRLDVMESMRYLPATDRGRESAKMIQNMVNITVKGRIYVFD
jgi:hypothetical protein